MMDRYLTPRLTTQKVKEKSQDHLSLEIQFPLVPISLCL